MTTRDKEIIETLPDEFKPLGAWSYFGLNILYCIPIIGTIFLIIHAVSGNNVVRRSYARSFVVSAIVGIVATALVLIITGTSITALFQAIGK